MIFLALILTTLVAFAWDYGQVLHRDDWFTRWQAQVSGLGLGASLSAVLSIIVPVILAQLVLNALAPMLFGIVWIAAAVFLLLYSFGRGCIGAQLEKYRSQCRREDFEAAYLYGSEELRWFSSLEAAQTRGPAQVHVAMQRAFLYQALQRWFAVLLYFLLLGPAAALAYRLLQLSADSGLPVQRFLAIADWVPARLLAAAFTLTGDFVESADELLAGVLHGKVCASDLLHSVAMAATGEDKKEAPEQGFGLYAARQNEMFAGLVRRSSVAWVVVVALIVLLL